jgi:hypothetical protein
MVDRVDQVSSRSGDGSINGEGSEGFDRQFQELPESFGSHKWPSLTLVHEISHEMLHYGDRRTPTTKKVATRRNLGQALCGERAGNRRGDAIDQ